MQWFRHEHSEGLRFIFLCKLAGVLAATLLFILAIAELTDAAEGILLLVREPPIYRDTRHFNHDHFFTLALGAYFFSLAKSRVEQLIWFSICVAVGYVLVWSGGRAAIGALAIFLALSAWLNLFSRRAIAAWVMALLAGMVLVLVAGRGNLFLAQFGRNGGDRGEITSGRIEIWLDSLAVWWDSWATTLFGLGPDAMRMAVRAKIGYPPLVQPHNTLVQVLIEFGLIGLCLFTVAAFIVGRRIFAVLRTPTAPQELRVTAALLVSLGAYMLVDGILYHAIPLIMTMFLTAYLFHYELDSVDSNGLRAKAFWSKMRSTVSDQ